MWGITRNNKTTYTIWNRNLFTGSNSTSLPIKKHKDILNSE